MNIIVPLLVIFLSALIQATFQVSLSALLLLFHNSKGKHVGAKTKGLVGSFISGAGLITFLFMGTIAFLIFTFFGGSLSAISLCIIVGLLLLLTFVVWFFYYRNSKSTELWIPKVVAKYIDSRAKSTDNNTEAFSLGMLTCFAELPFTLVLITVASNSLLEIPALYQGFVIVGYTLVAILPLIVFRIIIKRGKNAVDIQRWRDKHKKFLQIISGAGFLILALFLIAFKVLL